MLCYKMKILLQFPFVSYLPYMEIGEPVLIFYNLSLKIETLNWNNNDLKEEI